MFVNVRTRRKGFTLIELLVVLAIVGMVIALAFPALAAMRGMAYQAQCTTNLKTMGEVTQLYMIDYDGALPHLASDPPAEVQTPYASSSRYTPTYASSNTRRSSNSRGIGRTGGSGDGLGDTSGGCDKSNGSSAVVYATFSSDNTSVTTTSTKDLSNVVLKFADGVHEKHDNLTNKTGTFSGTGANAGKQIAGVWIKSGNNKSNDGPGYGEWVANPNDLTANDEEPEDNDNNNEAEGGEQGAPAPVTVNVSGWKIFDPRNMVCGEDLFPDYIEVVIDENTTETRTISYGANGLLLQSGIFYDDLSKPQKTAMLFDGNPTKTSAQVFDPRHYEEGMVLYGDWHVDVAHQMDVDMLGLK